MKEGSARGLAWVAFGLITALFVAAFALAFVNRPALAGGTGPSSITGALLVAAMFSFPLIGLCIASTP